MFECLNVQRFSGTDQDVQPNSQSGKRASGAVVTIIRTRLYLAWVAPSISQYSYQYHVHACLMNVFQCVPGFSLSPSDTIQHHPTPPG